MNTSNKTERLLFIVPPYVDYESFVNPAYNDGTQIKKSGIYRNIVADMPLGLLSLSAYIKQKADIEIKLLDFNNVLNNLESFEYNYIWQIDGDGF